MLKPMIFVKPNKSACIIATNFILNIKAIIIIVSNTFVLNIFLTGYYFAGN